MRIAFLGDVHGCVQHAVAAVRVLNVNLAIQIGDLGAYPNYAAALSAVVDARGCSCISAQ